MDSLLDGFHVEDYADASRYEGQFQQSQRHGTGEYFYSNGDKYTGTFRLDLRHGEGILQVEGLQKVADQEAQQESERNVPEEKNVSEIVSKEWASVRHVYKGQFQSNERHGIGTVRFADRRMFEGRFKCDKATGQGVMRYHPVSFPSNVLKENVFRRTRKMSIGLSPAQISSLPPTSSNVKVESVSPRKRIRSDQQDKSYIIDSHWSLVPLLEAITSRGHYSGQWQNDLRHGQGKLSFDTVSNESNTNTNNSLSMEELVNADTAFEKLQKPSDNCYIGQWKDDFLHGHGVLYIKNSFKYDGQFENGKMCGDGKLERRMQPPWVETKNNSFIKNDVSPTGSRNLNAHASSLINNNKSKLDIDVVDELPVLEIYEGRFECGRYNGVGLQTLPQCKVSYKGQFENNLRHGTGFWKSLCKHTTDACSKQVCIWYEGSFVKGLRHGEGKFFDPRGAESYIGQYRNGQRHGVGVLRIEQLDPFDCDIPTGRALLLHQQKNPQVVHETAHVSFGTYEGQFENGLRHGIGEWRGANGDVYMGQWAHNGKSGSGEFVSRVSRTHYEGQFSMDRFSGTGSIYQLTDYNTARCKNAEDGTIVEVQYNGIFGQGGRSGIGTQVWRVVEADDDVLSDPDFLRTKRRLLERSCQNEQQDVYEGYFQQDQMHGDGVLKLSCGDEYSGQFSEGRYHGLGKLTKSSGEIYEGQWSDGLPNGEGKLIQVDGSCYEGLFVDNRFHGTGALTSGQDGMIYRGNFEENVMQGEFECEYSDGRLESRVYKNGEKISSMPRLNFKGPVEYTMMNCNLPYDGGTKENG